MQLLVSLRAGYRQRRLFVQLLAVRPSTALLQNCRLLQQTGVCAYVTMTPSLTPGRPGYALRLGLRYLDGCPALQILTFAKRRGELRPLTHAALCQLSYTYPGVRFFLQTMQGCLPLERCVQQRCGGVLRFGLF